MKIKNIFAYSLPLVALCLTACQHSTSKPASPKIHATESQKSHLDEKEQERAKKENYIFHGKLTSKDKAYLSKLPIAAFGDSIMEGCRQDYQQTFPKSKLTQVFLDKLLAYLPALMILCLIRLLLGWVQMGLLAELNMIKLCTN